MKRFISILFVSFCLTGCGNYNPLAVLQFAPSESDSSNDETSGNSGAGAGTDIGNNQVPPPLYTIESLVSVEGETTGLASNREFLFWIDDVFGEGIWRSGRDGSDPRLLVPRLRQPEGLIVRGNALYWVERWNGKTLRRMLLDGSQPTTLRRVEDSYILPAMLIADEETVYWSVDTGDGATRYRIERISIADAAVTTLYRTPVPIQALQADTVFIYWMEGISSDFKLYRIAKSGGDPELLAEGLSEPITGLILSSDGVLFGSWSKILRIPNGSRSEEVLVSGPTHFTPSGLHLYQGKLYWINHTSGAIVSAPATGGPFSVVAGNLDDPENLQVLETGLYWAEYDPTSTFSYNRYRNWRHLAWNSQTPEILASGLFVSGVDVADGRFYFSEYDHFSRFAQMTSLPMAGGEVRLVLGGVNVDRSVLAAKGDDLFFTDGAAIKKVPAGGGPAKTFGIDGRWEIEHLYISEGSAYISSKGILPNGLYKVAAEGGVPIVLAENGMFDEYGEILAVHDGYVYYKFRPNADYPIFRKLYRVPVVGGSPERVLSLEENHEVLGFEAPTTVYYSNQTRDLLKYDIVTRQNQRLGFAGYRFLGFDDSFIFVDSSSSGTSVSRIPKDGSNFSEFILGIGSPYYLSGWHMGGGEIYFSASQLSNTGVLSEIARLQPTGN